VLRLIRQKLGGAQTTWLDRLIAAFIAAFEMRSPQTAPAAPKQPSEAPDILPRPEVPPEPLKPAEAIIATIPTVPESEVMLPWNMNDKLSHANFHNVRVICDQEGLTFKEKEELCGTIWGESDFYVHAKCENYAFHTVRDPKTGATHLERYLASTDHGICQWNDKWHPEITPKDAEFNPEKAVRLMAKAWKRGESTKKQWIAYKGGRYKQFLGRRL